ncbi:ATP-grasp domain-containing protein [Micromonospora rubida]|uniref:ATP-grasp domain-containing protein n=1 Tax=Micromonospora rubida TaxID=2697657 RepID=UPI0013773581|nr:ATP-dependent carboxylate-amine ligase [Micromonospora rubida]NBE80143.1 ATP-dependent carboxylate-amine ligase [Micromonospora rubida]
MILILTAPDDVHADAAEAELRRRGADWVRFDPADVPSRASLSIAIRDGRLTRILGWHPGTCGAGPGGSHRDGAGRQVVDLDAVTAVWFRRPGVPVAPAHLGEPFARFVVEESRQFVGDVWETLDVPALPAPRPVVLRAQQKVRQLQLALRLGFDVPATVVGNDPDVVLDLFGRTGGQLIAKQVGLSSIGDELMRFTEPVSHRDIGHVEGVRHCPFIAQARVPKKVELRVTVVGDRVFTAAIDSQRSNHARYDWRRQDDRNTPMSTYDLPDDVAARCVALTRLLGLRYGALDLIVTPDGRYVYIEINPTGQYLWVEEETGLPITAAVVDLLTDAVPTPGAAS